MTNRAITFRGIAQHLTACTCESCTKFDKYFDGLRSVTGERKREVVPPEKEWRPADRSEL